MARRIAISSGHGLYIRGASADPNPEPYNDEVDEVRAIVDRVCEMLTKAGHACVKFHDNTSTSQSTNLNTITSWHNKQSRDLDVSVHLNANAKTSSPMGCEVLYLTQSTLADQTSAAMASAGHFKDRGPKYRGDLAFLNNTSKPAILLECWFCDSSADCANGRKYREAICEAIAETIADVEIDEAPQQPPVAELPPDYTGDNRIEITTQIEGNVASYVNGALISGDPACVNIVRYTVTGHGDVTLVVNGEEFHSSENGEPPPNPNDVPLEDRPTISKGDEGNDVEDMQELLNEQGASIDQDGDFGSDTEDALIQYQATRGLAADGICGPQTWGALYDQTPPLPPPPHALSEHDITTICAIANDSAIAHYGWRDRGTAPKGYTQGVALAFAQTYRKLQQSHSAAVEMAKRRATSDKDALHLYWEDFEALGMSNEIAGIDTLRHLYALMLGSGMRESSGRHCEGRDQSATNTSSDTAEAGLFQTSYNAHSASEPEFGQLMTEYSNPANQATCYLAQFDDGVSCSESEWSCYGSGSGYAFQQLCKSCPAFAVETHGLTLRNLCNHYGPCVRHEIELKKEADEMLQAVQDYVDEVYATV